jgi:hypothetical protein
LLAAILLVLSADELVAAACVVDVQLAGAKRRSALHGFHVALESRVFLGVVHHEHIGLDIDRVLGTLG